MGITTFCLLIWKLLLEPSGLRSRRQMKEYGIYLGCPNAFQDDVGEAGIV